MFSGQMVGRRTDTFEAVLLEWSGGQITGIESVDSSGAVAEFPWISPGFVDLQINGCQGLAFNDPGLTGAQVETISRALAAWGVTCYCPTLTTDSFAVLSHALRTIASAICESRAVAARVGGVHVEGPYISAEDGPRGAHPRQHVRPPDWDEFCRLQDAAEGHIRILTLSPEYSGAANFISRVVDSGVVVAIGHTQADSDQLRAAVDAGARMSTHLGNGAHGTLRRHPNYLWDQMAEDRLTASLIVDGHHLPPAVVKTIVRAKTPGRCILVSDVTAMAGLPPGRYETAGLGAADVLEDGRLVIAGQRQLLAGASLPIGVGIANLVRFTEQGLGTAVAMATSGPAAILGQAAGRLEIGAPADLVQFRLPEPGAPGPAGDLQIEATIQGGERVWNASAS